MPHRHRKSGNYKMSDVQAVYVLQYLDKFSHIKSHTGALFRHFLAKTKGIDITLFPNFSKKVKKL